MFISASGQRRAVRGDKAEVGVGTLIIFIAMVLVAAVAAAVIIGTSGSLQQRAQETGMEATSEVSNNLRVVDMYGQRNSTSAPLYDIKIHAALASGATAIDLSRMVIRWSDGIDVLLYNHTTSALAVGGPPSAQFETSWVRGGAPGISVLRTGDLVEIHFNLYGTSLPERADATIQLIPESGSAVELGFRAPNTYSTDVVVRLV